MKSFILLLLLANFAAPKIWSGVSCPAAIKQEVHNGAEGSNGELQRVYQTLTRCAKIVNSSIDTLHLNIQQDGCVLSFKAEQHFNFRPGDRFPSLRELSLTGYHFNEYPRPSIQLNIQDGLYHFWWWLAGFTGVESLRPIPEIGRDDQAVNLLKWKAAMDWTKIRDLSLDKVDAVFLELMQGQLPALEALELDFLFSPSCLRKKITDFIVQSKPLRRLSLRGHTKGINLTEILDRHGDSIETLKIHEWEGDHFLRPTLSRSELEQITQKCPSLSKLGLDINRNGTWPYELLDSSAMNQNLSSLEIGLELGMNMHQESGYYSPTYGANKTEDFRQPLVDTDSSLKLFNRLRSLKQGVELQNMLISVGDAGREYGHMLRFEAWGETLAEVYECSVREADGEPWCEQLSGDFSPPEKVMRTMSATEFDLDEDGKSGEEVIAEL